MLIAGCRPEPTCEPRADHSVIACVDGRPVRAADVKEQLREGEARDAAMARAVRVKLFAAEARRRGLAGDSDARLHQALIRDEAAKLPAVLDADAHAYYAEHPGEFNKITAIDVTLLIDGAETAIGEAHADGVDPAVRRAANDLRAEGAISAPIQLADGRTAQVRADRIRMDVKPFEERAADVRNRLAHDREEAALTALEEQLRAAHAVQIFDAELAAMP